MASSFFRVVGEGQEDPRLRRRVYSLIFCFIYSFIFYCFSSFVVVIVFIIFVIVVLVFLGKVLNCNPFFI